MYSTDIKFIRKRDGRLEPFDPKKIESAIFAAAKAVGGEDIEKAREITRQAISFLEVIYKGDRVPTVENVQDLVEKILIENGHAKTAKAYILYREQHAKLRQTKALLSDAVNMVDNYIQQKDWRVKENANMGYSLQGLNNFISTAVSNKYWLDRIYSKEVAEKHLVGDLHIHLLRRFQPAFRQQARKILGGVHYFKVSLETEFIVKNLEGVVAVGAAGQQYFRPGLPEQLHVAPGLPQEISLIAGLIGPPAAA